MADVAARLFLVIRVGKKTTAYQVSPINAHPDIAARAWRLASGKKVYDVAIGANGWTSCTCSDAIYRSRECKHISSLRAMGLLPKGKT